MRLTEVSYTDAKPIDGYGPGFFRIGGDIFEGHVIACPDGAFTWQGYSDRDRLLGLAGSIDVLFVGTGSEIAHAPSDFRSALEAAGIGVEVMATAPAARTYNVLLGEGRRVAVALMAVEPPEQ